MLYTTRLGAWYGNNNENSDQDRIHDNGDRNNYYVHWIVVLFMDGSIKENDMNDIEKLVLIVLVGLACPLCLPLVIDKGE